MNKQNNYMKTTYIIPRAIIVNINSNALLAGSDGPLGGEKGEVGADAEAKSFMDYGFNNDDE